MNKSKEILDKHLLKNGWTKEIKKESNLYNTLVDAMEEAINYSQCCNELPSNSLADWANKKIGLIIFVIINGGNYKKAIIT